MSVDFLTRAALVALASYAALSTASALGVCVVWSRVAGRGAPRRVALRLFAIRLLPAVVGAAAAVIAVSAFVLFEPNQHHEAVGPAVLLPAGLGALLLAGGAGRVALALRASARLRRQWRAPASVRMAGCPVEILRAETPFPVVALMGWFRPRLIVASRVFDACTPAEIEAVIAHELAHLASRDNLRRTVLTVCPDVLAGSRTARAIERAWADATELAADDRAAHAGPRRRLDLASALVKVARLAVDVAPPPLPSSALFRGEPVADRVRRLLAPQPETPSSGRWMTSAWVVLGTIITLAVPASMPRLYEFIEAAIRLGR
jgi:Zn-dependent protease with chaperone function